MQKFYRFILLCLMLGQGFIVLPQADTTKPVKVAIFIPMYADEAFIGGEYSLGKANIPKNILSGLEFYNGVMMAVDSMNQEGVTAEIGIYDTKKPGLSVTQLISSPEFNNVGLIIAVITNPAELKVLSEQALAKNIPLISATYPNYVGVSENPFFVLLNSSFQAHLQGLHRYMQKNYPSTNIIAITRKGSTEDFIKNYMTDLNKASSTPLKFKWMAVNDSLLTPEYLQRSLDSTKQNVVFVASPSESFGVKVVRDLAANELYPITAVGMPTWDGVKALDKPDCRNVNIVYSTPFLYSSQNMLLASSIYEKYKEKYYSRPSDMAFKGLETTYHFTKLLIKHRNNLVNNLSDKAFTLFNQFQLEPVKLKKTSVKPDLIENKKLYFIKKQQGNIKNIS